MAGPFNYYIFPISITNLQNYISTPVVVPPGRGDRWEISGALPIEGIVKFNWTPGNSIYLCGVSTDPVGVTPVSFNTLPAGFTLVDARFRLFTSGIDDGGGDTAFLTLNGISPIDISAELTSDPDLNHQYLPLPAMLSLLNNGVTLDVTLDPSGFGAFNWETGVLPSDPDFVSPFFLCVFGTYDITVFQYQWTLIQPTNKIQQGTQVTITSDLDNPDALDFEQILTMTFDWTDSDGNPHSVSITPDLWITVTINLFIFTVPSFGAEEPQIVILNATSTQFSGSVPLGKLIVIFFENATGIYSLTPGKSNDTIYDNDNGDTMDVKIPNPFFKTGFIGG